jgi:hypothetical protein
MCLASKYLNQLDNVIKDMNCDYKKLSVKLSEYDSLISEHYHKIETTNFNACEGYYLTKQLQEILRKRRVIKHEMERLNSMQMTLGIKNNLTDEKLNNSKKRIKQLSNRSCKYQQDWKYTYTLEEILN